MNLSLSCLVTYKKKMVVKVFFIVIPINQLNQVVCTQIFSKQKGLEYGWYTSLLTRLRRLYTKNRHFLTKRMRT